MTVFVFVGYDERQDLAFKACRQSIYDVTPFGDDVRVVPVCHRLLRQSGMFTREWTTRADGITIDKMDGRPFSTNFAFTRFLVPHMADNLFGYSNESPVVFVDSDFIFRESPTKMVEESDFATKPVSVVKHNYEATCMTKMDNQSQANYNRKLWSSLMIFNMKFLGYFPTIRQVNEESGRWLHGFEWLPDKYIGDIPERWNYIPKHSEPRVQQHNIGAVHYTEGTFLTTDTRNYEDQYLFQTLQTVLERAKSDTSILRLIS
jgi:hypothetical protein